MLCHLFFYYSMHKLPTGYFSVFVARLVDLGHILCFLSPHSCDPFSVLPNELVSLQHGGKQPKLVRMCIVLLFYLWLFC